MFFIDPLYIIIVGPAFILAIIAQVKVKGAVKKWSKVRASSGMTGAQAARRILDAAGLSNVDVEVSQGWLSDHYDPKKKVLRLSPDIYQTPSVAAVGIAAHEAGHALQDAKNYAPMKFRNAIVPTASIGSWLAWPLIAAGFLLSIFLNFPELIILAKVGFVLFLATVIFQIVTLPVEFNASSRAKKLVFDLGVVGSKEEADGVSSVLNAAAMTYVAATVAALLQVFYLALRLGILGDD